MILLAQANLSLKVSLNQYFGNFDATVEYLMNQVAHKKSTSNLILLA